MQVADGSGPLLCSMGSQGCHCAAEKSWTALLLFLLYCCYCGTKDQKHGLRLGLEEKRGVTSLAHKLLCFKPSVQSREEKRGEMGGIGREKAIEFKFTHHFFSAKDTYAYM